MNGRKREEKREEREDESKRKSERSELRPPDTSTLPPPLTLPTLISQTSLNTLQIPTFNNILCNTLSTIRPTFPSTLIQNSLCTYFHTTHSITITRVCTSRIELSTASFRDAEHITPFTSTVGNRHFVNSRSSGTCLKDITFNTVIVDVCLDVDTIHRAYIEHLIESVAWLTSARCVERLIEVRCSL